MSFDWRKYLELSEYIVKHRYEFSDEESCYRTVVSRAYYAAFGVVRCYIKETDRAEYESGDAHKKVRDHLMNSKDKLKRKIANQLKDIYQNRKKADYDDTIEREPPCKMAFKTMSMANKIISEIDALRNCSITL